MNFVVYPVFRKKTNSEKKNLVKPFGTGQNKTYSNKKKTLKVVPIQNIHIG